MPAKPTMQSDRVAQPQRPNKVIAILIILALLISAISTIALLVTINPQEEMIRNLFVDINGDGRVDYIKNAIVIFNDESVKNFP